MFSDVNFSKQERNSFDQVDHNLEWLSSNPNQPRQQNNFSMLALHNFSDVVVFNDGMGLVDAKFNAAAIATPKEASSHF